MKKNKPYFLHFFLFLIFLSVNTPSFSEIMILSKCKSLKDSFIKNEYIIDLEKSLMIRNYIYDNKTYKKYRVTDLSIKKENSIERFIYEERFSKNKDQQIIELKEYIKKWKGKKNLVLITHYVVISEMLNISTTSGEIVISDKNYNVIERLKISY